jgi:hypothetical protein
MLPLCVLVAAMLAADVTAHAQEEAQPRGQTDQGDTPRVAVPRVAVPRAEAPRREPEPARAAPDLPAAQPQRAEPVRAERGGSPEADDQRRAEPRGTRPRGDNPPIGRAVPRDGRQPVPDRGGRDRDRDRTVIVTRPPVYNYYYPRRYYPYGYGGFGLGYFYYDPYRWSLGYPTYGGAFYGDVWRSGRYYGSFYDIGELRLRVTPRHAQVFVDGYYAGEVDDYDGVLQSMKMETGPYHIELRAPGYETLEFDVRILPGQKINYRGDLRRLP